MGSSLPLTGVYSHHPATPGTGAAPQPGKGTGLAQYLSLEHLQPLLGVRTGRAGAALTLLAVAARVPGLAQALPALGAAAAVAVAAVAGVGAVGAPAPQVTGWKNTAGARHWGVPESTAWAQCVPAVTTSLGHRDKHGCRKASGTASTGQAAEKPEGFQRDSLAEAQHADENGEMAAQLGTPEAQEGR